MRRIWVILVIGALLVAGCARGQSRDGAVPVIDPMQQAIADASSAALAMQTAAQKGDTAGVKTAYERFRSAFVILLGPVSLEDPKVAQRMANANTTIEAMVAAGKIDPAVLRREVSNLTKGLQDAAVTMATARVKAAMAGGKSLPVNGAGLKEQTVDVTAVDFRFQPAEIRVAKGTRVTVRFTNKGTKPHEFEIDALGFEIGPIQPGRSASKSFVADKPGRYTYYCGVDDHLQKGMKGSLIVE